MKAAMLMVLATCSHAGAHEIQCPKYFPSEDTKLSEVPYQHKGVGIASRSRISGAGVVVGELSAGSEQVGARTKAKGGYDVRFGFDPQERKWLVCSYGRSGDINWWEELPKGVSRCTLQVRESGGDPMDAKLRCT